MKQYILTLAPVPGIAALATAATFERPDDYLLTLGGELASLGIKGEVMLDLLAANGSETRRFFTVPFDGERFSLQRFTRIPTAPEEVRAAATKVLRDNLADIDLALVPTRLRLELLVGLNPAAGAQAQCCYSEGCMRALARA